MKIITKISQIQNIIQNKRRKGKTVGFVPTMGALHEGHLSLFRRAKRENDFVVASLFVNPKQFNSREDLKKYPREKKRDVLLTRKEKIDIIFYPSVEEMYPTSFLTNVDVGKITKVLCGKYRNGHFRGVTTVVAKLLNTVMPDRLYLGQKDAQQCLVIRKMVEDLNWPISIKVCPIIREKDGLALSSRNKYLSQKQRNEAKALYQALTAARWLIRSGKQDTSKIKAMIRSMIKKNTTGKIEYVECVDADTLKPLKKLKGRCLIALAVWFGRARLIDNIVVRI